MKDFDFEELDRAVSSALGGGRGDRSAPPVKREVERPAEREVERAPAAPASNPAPRPPQGGRFMDIMHPGGAPKTPSATSPALSRAETPAPAVENTPEPEAPQEIESVESILSSPSETEVAPEPIETPFISNPVVEKRPLGGPVSGSTKPAEGIESQLLEAEKFERSYSQPAVSGNTEPDSTFVSPTHSAQQTSSSPARSIYDTEAYTAPVESKKKKSALWIVLWIALLVVVGAGSGAAVYFFILQPL